ncbi:MAG: type II toxin-antitoxin system VapC family toxin [Actinobacteria bacterium]|nr:type II toxin-antitoxin system VapC family toxin [Actinomycetota bacterium]
MGRCPAARQSRKTVRPSAGELIYADSSALVKLILDEPERAALESYLKDGLQLASSRLATVEVSRAVKVANGGPAGRVEAESLLQRCFLVDVDDEILARAAELASRELWALDAIHLASAEYLGPKELIAYDSRLLRAAQSAGLRTASPGA